MPKAGFEPARLAAPPPQDGVSASSTTSARLILPLLLFRSAGRCRSTLLLLRLCRSLLSRLRLLLLLLLLLFCPFPYNRGTSGPRNQNCQRQGSDHEDNCCHGCGFAQDRTGAAGSERGLSSTAAEGSSPVSAFALLHQHNKN